MRAGPHGYVPTAGRYVPGAAPPPRRLPPRFSNRPTAVNNAASRGSYRSQTNDNKTSMSMQPATGLYHQQQTTLLYFFTFLVLLFIF